VTPPASGTLPETQVRAMFDRIARVYDRMNSVMTAGMHHRWRRRAADLARVGPGSRALDVATGTGDLAIELSARGAEVVGLDFSERMLELARAKARRIPSGIPNPAHPAEPGASRIPNPARPAEPGASGIEFVQGNALELVYPDASFDAVTVGFGARNFADLDRGLSELARVTRPGGRVVILEITTPQKPPLSWFFRFWFDRAVPALGRLAGDPDAYSYLPSSVRRFPGPRELAERLAATGLEDVRWVLTAGGIIAIHAGTRNSPPAHPAEPGASGGR
jgi:demethylmenaquinone methyltransferase/2-methoxy-6-polyprenyl-1,4-benzoquinol methylase